jgi:hypothetical protein
LEEKEMLADAGRRLKNLRRMRWNRLRLFRVEKDAGACRSFAAVEWDDSDRLLGTAKHEARV